jgi:hypothetical protein
LNEDLRILGDGMNRKREWENGSYERTEKEKGETKKDTKRKRFMHNDRITSTTMLDKRKALAGKFLSL